MMDAMFETPSKKMKSFEVSKEYAQKQLDQSHLQ
jgi:ATP-dependent Clp protease ATP-binding subunit ClpX